MSSARILGNIQKSGNYYSKGKTRPGFETWVYEALPGVGVYEGEARCHFVSFEAIQYILVEILNRYAKRNSQKTFLQAIRAFAQIFLDFYKDEEYKNKVNAKIDAVWRAFRVNMTLGGGEDLFLAEINQYLSYLNSCPGNLRFPFVPSTGNSWNSSIGRCYDPGEWSCWYQGKKVTDRFDAYYVLTSNADLRRVEIQVPGEDAQRIRSVDGFCHTYQIDGSLKLATAYTEDESGKYPFVYSSDNGFDLPESCSRFSGRIVLV